MPLRSSTLLIYTAALCLLLGGASIAPPPAEKYYYSESHHALCSTLVEKLPCEDMGGPWTHVCKATVSVSCSGFVHILELSRQLPEHVAAMAVDTSSVVLGHATAGLGGMKLRQQAIVRPLGLSLGLGLLTLGRLLYNPCLFYLPAVLAGYTMIQPLNSYLIDDVGFPPHFCAIFGALLGIVFAFLQRHIVVGLLGMLLGVLAFLALYLSTSQLNELPLQLLLPLGLAFGLAGSSVMLKLERTYLWKVLACSLVGSMLLTDAIGLAQLSELYYSPLQYASCSVLVLLSCYHQVSCSRKAARELQERERRLRVERDEREERERKERERKDRAKRRKTAGADGRDADRPTVSSQFGTGLFSLLTPRKCVTSVKPKKARAAAVKQDEEEEDVFTEEEAVEAEEEEETVQKSQKPGGVSQKSGAASAAVKKTVKVDRDHLRDPPHAAASSGSGLLRRLLTPTKNVTNVSTNVTTKKARAASASATWKEEEEEEDARTEEEEEEEEVTESRRPLQRSQKSGGVEKAAAAVKRRVETSAPVHTDAAGALAEQRSLPVRAFLFTLHTLWKTAKMVLFPFKLVGNAVLGQVSPRASSSSSSSTNSSSVVSQMNSTKGGKSTKKSLAESFVKFPNSTKETKERFPPFLAILAAGMMILLAGAVQFSSCWSPLAFNLWLKTEVAWNES